MTFVRRATVDDIDVLIDLRMAFVTEFADVDDADQERESLAEYLARALASEAFMAWLVDHDGRVTATAGICTSPIRPTSASCAALSRSAVSPASTYGVMADTHLSRLHRAMSGR